MDKPTVSIITPAYNAGKYISATVNSVLRQTFDDFELIIIDDGSKDNTAEIVRTFLFDPRIRYIFQENKGQASARNHGIRESKGSYIAFLDSDDLWASDKLAKQMDLINESQAQVCYTDVEIINADTEEVLPYSRVGWFEKMRRGDILPFLIYYNFIPFASVVVCKESLDRIGGMDESIIMGDDWDVLLRLATSCRFDYVDERLLKYRAGHSTQLSQKIELRYKYQDIIIDKLFKQYPDSLLADYEKKTSAFRCRERANAFVFQNSKRSWKYLSQAIVKEPLNLGNYKLLLKIVASTMGIYRTDEKK